MNSYFDELGRVHTKPIRFDDKFPTNNAWIYTAIYETIRLMNRKPIVKGYYDSIDLCRVRRGLYSRHPLPYRLSPNMTPISHDEIIGIAMLSRPDSVIISFGDFYFCDIPNYEDESKHSLIDKLKSAWSYLYRVLVNKESERKITRQYPALFGIFFTHRRQYRYIYQSLAYTKKSLPNTLAWSLSRVLDSLTSSVSLLHYMAMLRMEQRGEASLMFKLVSKLMKRSIIRKYGERPVQALLIEYLLNGTGNVDKNHPWLIEITEYYGNRGE